MKKTFKYFAFAMATLVAIVSCQKIVETDTQDGPKVNEEEVAPTFVYKFNIAGNETTKTTLEKDGSGFFSQWETGDVIGSITTKESGSSSVTPADGETPASFSIKSTGGLSVGDAINVYFPYSGSVQSDPTAVEITIPTAQSQGSKFDYDAMPMVAKEITVTAGMASVTDETAIGTVQFVNLGSLVNFKVYSSNATYATEKVKSVTFNANKALAGTFSVDLTSVDPADPSTLEIDGYAETSVTTSLATASAIGADKEHALDVYMVVAPDSYTGSIMVTTDMATYTFPISSSITIARSGLKGLGLNLGGANAVRYAPSVSWSLATNTSSSNNEDLITWSSDYCTFTAAKAGGSTTAANNYLGKSSQTRFYPDHILTFTPASGITITKVILTGYSSTGATRFQSSTWSGATASIDSKDNTKVIVIPSDGTTAFTATIGSNYAAGSNVQVFYMGRLAGATAKAITITPPTNGTLTASAASAKEGEIITLTPTPSSGYTLSSLTVTDANSQSIPVSAKYQFAMPSTAVTVAATFTISYDVTISSSIANGTVTANKAKAAAGETVTLTATPGDGYGFVSWNVVDESSNPVAVTDNSFTMPSSNVTVSATFGRLYTISIPTPSNGTVSTNYGGDGSSAPEGALVSITVTPSGGYSLNTLTVTNATAEPNEDVPVSMNSFIMPNGNVNISAIFAVGAPDPETIVISGVSDQASAHSSIAFEKNNGSNAPTYNDGDEGVRLYPKNTMTIGASSPYKISKIDISYLTNANKSGTVPSSITSNSGSFSTAYSTDTGAHEMTWEKGASAPTSVTLTVNGTAGNVAIKSVKVYYE